MSEGGEREKGSGEQTRVLLEGNDIRLELGAKLGADFLSLKMGGRISKGGKYPAYETLQGKLCAGL